MNWSYIAGFFDGEGSISPNQGGFRISIPQTHEQVLNQIRNFTKVGFVIRIKKRQIHWKDAWLYYIASKKDVLYFLKQVSPNLTVKKELSIKTIKLLEKQLVSLQEKQKIHDQRKSLAKKLRSKGWSYRKIGKELKIDWGYTRRLILDLV